VSREQSGALVSPSGVRLVPLLVLALVLAACGSGTEGPAASSGSSEESAEGSGTAPGPGGRAEVDDEPGPEPPRISLLYKGQKQNAVPGSYCVTGQGSGVCMDSAAPLYPNAVTSVMRGDRVTFVLPEAMFKAESAVTIRPLGCWDRAVRDFALTPGAGEHEWKVDLPSGAYQLDVFALFEAEDGRSGDVTGSLALTVAGPKKWDALGVGAIADRMPVCEFAD
jgi:hypothetical protein